ncbi:hypothetical protein A2685_01025 [Candidatus Woesebacteria bacterium RIFCSPHIGHO2_01_FULL_37_10]|uniref:DUF8173 domain-containing protein n=1 Tax=Candidatus Woesebacteria bacterium RIFCSPHIGHO2_01_FULL_37_10 TaxID=1802489 RepID=A0A1F7XUY4_9BACT|nr:MAG: hypothetical protein A2685_01025 [Candidatus Woesebacteria bacterium RIFCSPHIGHO2_01_FULL_37_10]
MKKFILLSIVSLLFAFGNSSVNASNIDTRTQRVTKLPRGEKIEKDFYVTAGEVVEIAGEVKGDVLVAGGQLLVSGKVDGDLIAAGGTLDISGEVTQNIRAAGGEIVINGIVGRNLSVAGGNVRIASPGVIKGSAVIFGGNISLDAPVSGDVFLASGNANLSGEIDGDIEGYVGTLIVTSEAKINGNLEYTSDTEAEVDKDASISGKILRKSPPLRMAPDTTSVNGIVKEFAKASLFFKLIGFISASILGLILIKYAPNYLSATALYIEKNMLKSFGLGFLLLILTPVLFIVLLITLVGMPLAFISLFIYIIFIYLSKIFIAFTIGMKISEGYVKNINIKYLIGLTAFYIITLIPVAGSILSFLALCIGLGASLASITNVLSKAGKNNII